MPVTTLYCRICRKSYPVGDLKLDEATDRMLCPACLRARGA